MKPEEERGESPGRRDVRPGDHHRWLQGPAPPPAQPPGYSRGRLHAWHRRLLVSAIGAPLQEDMDTGPKLPWLQPLSSNGADCPLSRMQSYAKRTVIDGFDPMFNAITGLNGSGKSNILDSICFVLGISRLEQVHTPAPPDAQHARTGRRGSLLARLSARGALRLWCLAGPRGVAAGAHLQAGAGGRSKGHRHDRLQQQGQEGQPCRLRGVR